MSRMKSEDVIAGLARPFTGAEYLESLRDGREVYIYGERVADVTTHPAFRNAARSISQSTCPISSTASAPRWWRASRPTPWRGRT